MMEFLLISVFIIWLIGYSMGRSSVHKERQRQAAQQQAPQEPLPDAHTAELAEGIQAEEQNGPEPALIHTQPASTPSYKPLFSRDIKSLDSVSTLLYFGAFLMIAGVGLFVGLSGFSGTVKTVAVGLLAIAFYSAGLYVYDHIKRLKPAAITFTSIGLICLPLTGVAAYTYLTQQQFGPLIWCATSALCLALYAVAIWRIRQSFIGYLSVFMCLSLWLSIVAVVQAPIYFFGWAMVILGALYLLAGKYFTLWHELQEPLGVSASIMVPTALTLTVLFGSGAISLLHQGITLLLGAVFYAVACWLEQKPNERLTYFVLAYALLPISSLFISYDLNHSWVATSFVVTAVSLAQLAATLFARQTLQPKWLEYALNTNAIFLASAAALCATTANWPMLSWILTINLAAHCIAGLYARHKMHMAFGLTALLLLPGLVGSMALTPAAPRFVVAGIYLLIGFGLMLTGRTLGRRVADYRLMALTGYWLAWLLAWLTGLAGPDWQPAAASAAVAIAAIASAYYERQPDVIYLAAGLGGASVLQYLHFQAQLNGETIAWLLGALGGVYYLCGKLQRSSNHNWLGAFHAPWVMSGMAILYAAALFGLFANGVTWPGIISLLAAGAVTSYESYTRHEKTGVYVGAAIMLTAVEFALYHIGLREWQIYWYLWAAYSVVLAYLERLAGGIYVGALLAGIGIGIGLSAHHMFTLSVLSLAGLAVSAVYYTIGKAHGWLAGEQAGGIGEAWTYCGIAGFYLTAWLPFAVTPVSGHEPLLNSLSLMAAGAVTIYEGYRRGSYVTEHFGGAVVLAGLQWMVYQQDIREFQLYTHMWAAYFVALAFISHRGKRDDEMRGFTILALLVQTLPLAWQALGGNSGYGLLLLLESIGIMLVGLWIKYPLVSRWGLAVAVASVLYQLREFQFFVLALLGAGIIGLGIFLLLRNDKK